MDMDHLAKEHISFAKPQSTHIKYRGTSFLRIEVKGLQKFLHYHLWDCSCRRGKKVVVKKSLISAEIISSIHWEAIGKAMLQSSRTKRTFISKDKLVCVMTNSCSNEQKEISQLPQLLQLWRCPACVDFLRLKLLHDMVKITKRYWRIDVLCGTGPNIQSAILHHLNTLFFYLTNQDDGGLSQW